MGTERYFVFKGVYRIVFVGAGGVFVTRVCILKRFLGFVTSG